MEARFEQFIRENRLFSRDDRILVAVSGGPDSVALCHLLSAHGFQFAIAHCNFQLRGHASDEDERFVEQLASALSVPFYSTTFDTYRLVEDNKASVQMLARELRYEWLENIRMLNRYDWIATAHHLNDSIETFLYNFSKGTGLKGLRGIPMRKGKIIRPLIFAAKSEILDFLRIKNYRFREDISNSSDKYARNKIRLQVMPVLKRLNPSLESTALKTFTHLNESYELYEFAVESIKKKLLQRDEDQLKIDLDILDQIPAKATVLYECLKDCNFHPDQIPQIMATAQNNPGAMFYSFSHCLLVDRNYLVIRAGEEMQDEVYSIAQATSCFSFEGHQLIMKRCNGLPENWQVPDNIALLDAEKIQFPLSLRHWREGDIFYPLGMKGKRQKLQDFFSN